MILSKRLKSIEWVFGKQFHEISRTKNNTLKNSFLSHSDSTSLFRFSPRHEILWACRGFAIRTFQFAYIWILITPLTSHENLEWPPSLKEFDMVVLLILMEKQTTTYILQCFVLLIQFGIYSSESLLCLIKFVLNGLDFLLKRTSFFFGLIKGKCLNCN